MLASEKSKLVGGEQLQREAESTSSACSLGCASSSSSGAGGKSLQEIEDCVSAVIKKILDGRSLGRFENFFVAGLHSVSAARARSELAQQLGPIPVAALYQHPCAASLAACIHTLRHEGQLCSGQEATVEGGAAVSRALTLARLQISCGASAAAAQEACALGLVACNPTELLACAPADVVEAARQLQLLSAVLASQEGSEVEVVEGRPGPCGIAAPHLSWWPPPWAAGASGPDTGLAEEAVQALGQALQLCGNSAEGAADAAAVLAAWACLLRVGSGSALQSLAARHVECCWRALQSLSTGWQKQAGCLLVASGKISQGLDLSIKTKSLLTLELEELGLTSFPAELFALMESLRTLSLSHNRLSDLPPEIRHLSALRSLSVAANSLAFLPDEVASLPSLTALVIAGNRIRNAVGEASACRHLASLDASVQSATESGVSVEVRQRARRVRAGTAPQSGSLETLEISHSGLAEGPQLGVGCGAALRYYLCTANELEKVPDLKRCPGLTSLELGQNRLRVVPAKFLQGVPDLRWLSLEANSLPKLPASLGCLRLLRHLMLQGNRLESLPEELGNCTQLRVLELQHNRLTALPHGLERMRSLQFFYIHGNLLADATAVFVKLRAVGSLKLVGLGGNLLDLGGMGPPDLLLPSVRLGCGWNRGEDHTAVVPEPSLGMPQLTEVLSCGDAWHFDPAVQGRRGRVLAVCFMAQGSPTCQWVGQVQACRAALLDVDALYIADPANAWYLQDPERRWQGIEHFSALLQQHLPAYGNRVLMVGSSMGATACVLFAAWAGLVLAFSPQVELRAGQGRFLEPALLDRFEQQMDTALRSCPGRVVIHVGRRHHFDALAARKLAAKAPDAVHVAYHETDQHNTTKYLSRMGHLTAAVRLAVSQLSMAAALGEP